MKLYLSGVLIFIVTTIFSFSSAISMAAPSSEGPEIPSTSITNKPTELKQKNNKTSDEISLLPKEMQVHILKYFTTKELAKIKEVNTTFNCTAQDRQVRKAGEENSLKFLTEVGIRMISLPGGTFMMGSPENESDDRYEEDLHKVELSPFKVTQSKITRAQWRKIMGSDPNCSEFTAEDKQTWNQCPDCPVTYVSWNDIQRFIAVLKKHGIKADLPTEAQQEFYMRGKNPDGTVVQSAFPWGNDRNLLHQHAWFSGNNEYLLHPVGTTPIKENTWGLFDAIGNADEWSRNEYARAKTRDPMKTTKDPIGSDDNHLTSIHGGCQPEECRPASHRLGEKKARSNCTSFRFVIEQEPSKK